MEIKKSKVLIQFLLIFRQSGDALFFVYARRFRGYTATMTLGVFILWTNDKIENIASMKRQIKSHYEMLVVHNLSERCHTSIQNCFYGENQISNILISKTKHQDAKTRCHKSWKLFKFWLSFIKLQIVFSRKKNCSLYPCSESSIEPQMVQPNVKLEFLLLWFLLLWNSDFSKNSTFATSFDRNYKSYFHKSKACIASLRPLVP